jgi:hypothetical protein
MFEEFENIVDDEYPIDYNQDIDNLDICDELAHKKELEEVEL